MLARIQILCLFLLLYAIDVFSKDYIQYHKSIIRAEEQIFIQNKVADGLKTYQQVFSQYDFVFAHDCVNAMQIALYANDENSFLKFADKATKNGLRKSTLAKFSYIIQHPIYLKNKDSIEALCKANRSYYLKRLDTTVLLKIYPLYALDQTQKNNRQSERRADYERRYARQIAQTMQEFKQLANNRGFPGDKLTGIAQNDIMAELRIDKHDLLYYYYEYKDESSVRKDQFQIEEYQLSNTNFIIPILIHYAHALKEYHFFSDEFYKEQIRKGNLHPKDFALINDLPFDVSYDGEHFRKPNFAGGEMYFKTGEKQEEGSVEKASVYDAEINRYRAKYFIAPIEQDQAKRKFMKEHKMYYGWGWGGNRS